MTDYNDPSVQYDDPSVSYDGDDLGGGTTYEQPVSGSTSLVGSLIKRARDLVAGAVSPLSTLTRRAHHALHGSTTPGADLILEAHKRFDAALEPEAVVILAAERSLSGSLGIAGNHTSTATLHVSGDLGELTGELITTFVPPGTGTHYEIGNVAPSGSIRKRVLKSLSGAASLSGAVTIPTQRRGGLAGYAGPIISIVTAYDPRTEATELMGLLRPSGHLVITTKYGTPRHMRHWERNKRVLLAEMDEDLAELV